MFLTHTSNKSVGYSTQVISTKSGLTLDLYPDTELGRTQFFGLDVKPKSIRSWSFDESVMEVSLGLVPFTVAHSKY